MPVSSSLFCERCRQYQHFVHHEDRLLNKTERIVGEFWRCSVCHWERQWGAHA